MNCEESGIAGRMSGKRLCPTGQQRSPLPPLMHSGTNLLVVNPLNLLHEVRGEGRYVGRRAIIHNLIGPLAAGNGTGDGVKHQNPAQGELSHRNTRRNQGADFFDGRQAEVVVHTGKSLSYIKSLAVTIEIAVVVIAKR